MNIENMETLANHLERLPNKQFSMNSWLYFSVRDENPTCGAVGCIAGWACILSGEAMGNSKYLFRNKRPLRHRRRSFLA